MWLRTLAQWRKSPRLERWPVAVQLTQTKRVTPAQVGGPAAEGLYTDVQSLSLPWTQYCLKQIGSHWQSSVTGSPGTDLRPGAQAGHPGRRRILPVTRPGPLLPGSSEGAST